VLKLTDMSIEKHAVELVFDGVVDTDMGEISPTSDVAQWADAKALDLGALMTVLDPEQKQRFDDELNGPEGLSVVALEAIREQQYGPGGRVAVAGFFERAPREAVAKVLQTAVLADGRKWGTEARHAIDAPYLPILAIVYDGLGQEGSSRLDLEELRLADRNIKWMRTSLTHMGREQRQELNEAMNSTLPPEALELAATFTATEPDRPVSFVRLFTRSPYGVVNYFLRETAGDVREYYPNLDDFLPPEPQPAPKVRPIVPTAPATNGDGEPTAEAEPTPDSESTETPGSEEQDSPPEAHAESTLKQSELRIMTVSQMRGFRIRCIGPKNAREMAEIEGVDYENVLVFDSEGKPMIVSYDFYLHGR